jgi:hypothetical protein
MMRIFSACLVLILVVIGADMTKAQFREKGEPLPNSNNALVSTFEFGSTSVRSVDMAQERGRWTEGDLEKPVGTEKNGFIAAGLSFLIPGLGEYYVGDQIWRGAIFTVLEAGLWYGRIHWTKRGDDSLLAFHAWADSLWLPTRYVGYLDSLMLSVSRKTVIKDPNNFGQINAEEDTLNSLNFADFTHRLPGRGEQQYYELISKYIQFKYGWVDNTSTDPNVFSADYTRHADMRATMNYQYEVADDFLYGIILNHVLSAIDAALLSKDHNSKIRLHGELQRMTYPNGTLGYLPTAAIEVRF